MEGKDQPGTGHWFVLPATAAGRWSLRLVGAFLILFVVMQLEVAAGQRGGDTFFANPYLSLTALAARACVVAAGAVAALAVVAHHERSVLVLLTLLLGSLVTIFVAGELIVPHRGRAVRPAVPGNMEGVSAQSGRIDQVDRRRLAAHQHRNTVHEP